CGAPNQAAARLRSVRAVEAPEQRRRVPPNPIVGDKVENSPLTVLAASARSAPNEWALAEQKSSQREGSIGFAAQERVDNTLCPISVPRLMQPKHHPIVLGSAVLGRTVNVSRVDHGNALYPVSVFFSVDAKPTDERLGPTPGAVRLQGEYDNI